MSRVKQSKETCRISVGKSFCEATAIPGQCRTQDLPNPADISNLKLESELNTKTTMNLSQTGVLEYDF
jgi:hypothetical protein